MARGLLHVVLIGTGSSSLCYAARPTVAVPHVIGNSCEPGDPTPTRHEISVLEWLSSPVVDDYRANARQHRESVKFSLDQRIFIEIVGNIPAVFAGGVNKNSIFGDILPTQTIHPFEHFR
jgi:hypothetical protein